VIILLNPLYSVLTDKIQGMLVAVAGNGVIKEVNQVFITVADIKINTKWFCPPVDRKSNQLILCT
jgi:hypothetical protein